MTYQTLTIERSGETAIVRLNRPEKLNAINAALQLDLIALCDELEKDLSTRFVIVTGAGRAFSAGADVDAMGEPAGDGDPSPGQAARLGQFRGQKMLRSLEQLEQITVAAIEGYCLGGAVSIAMACDFRISSEKAVLGLPETNLGIFYTWGSSPRLARIVGPSRAKEWIMTCENVDGAEAHRWGLIDKVVAEGTALDAARKLIGKIEGRGPTAIRLTKKLINAWAFRGMSELLIAEPELTQAVALSGETEEGVAAFLEKRPARYHE